MFVLNVMDTTRTFTMVFCADAGKVWKPKEEEKVQINEDEKVETEWDEVLAQATEEELVDLAGLYFKSYQIIK